MKDKLTAAFNTTDTEADNSQTPYWLVNQLESVANVHFIHDVCARSNSKKAPTYWDKKSNALKKSWHKKYIELQGEFYSGAMNAFFMNPPFSLQTEFQNKALDASHYGVVTLGCCSHSPDRDWFQKMELTANYLFVPDGRIQFLKHDGTKFTRIDKKTSKEVSTGAAFPVCFPLWLPYPNGGQVQIIRFKRNQKGFE